MTHAEVARPLRAVVTAFVVFVVGCGADAAGDGPPGSGVQVQPPTATVPVLATAAFTASTEVDWSVREGAVGGTVTSVGTYTAPASPGTFHVVATSRGDGAVSASATVTVTPAGGTGEVLAFPGAEGFGARATGGRGGQVLKVTNLNASGPGSLQAALNVNAPRIIVFAVSGVIQGNATVSYGNVTIAGQTAPGGGITIAGRLTGAYDFGVQNIIVRHVRVRPPRCVSPCSADQYDAIQFSRNNNLILDHVSVAYGADETIDIYEADDVTIQWTTIEASQVAPQHSDGATHNYGVISGPDGRRVTFHHNLCAHHRRRCPAIANGPADVRNNVAYNVRHAFLHSNPAQGGFNFVGNFFKQGPNDSLMPYFFDDEDPATRPSYYLRDSYVDDPAGYGGGTFVGSIDNPWTLPSYFVSLSLDETYRVATELDFSASTPGYVPVTTETSQQAYESVLSRAGAFPRDGFTAATVAETRTRGGGWDPQLPANLMSGLTPAAPPPDGDGDGMADAWESARGLSPTNGADHATVMGSGYTAIEEYVNELAAALVQ